MRTIQVTELKAKLSAILGDVERGETIAIQRHGRTIGKIAPFDEGSEQRLKAAQAIRTYKKSAGRTGLTVEDILSARDEGRP